MKIYRIAKIILLVLSLCMASCSLEDGADGMDGKDGINGKNGLDGINGTNGKDGTDGANGTDGTDGTDGLGFDEFTKYGHIILKMEGERVDGVLFQDSTAFKFTPVDPATFPIANNVNSGGSDHTFNITRFLSAPDNTPDGTNSYVKILFEITDLGEDSQSIDLFGIEINEYAIVGDDNKFFVVDGTWPFYPPDVDGIIMDVAYDTTTNHLTFSFAFTVPEAENVTGNDLHISGEVDVTVLEQL